MNVCGLSNGCGSCPWRRRELYQWKRDVPPLLDEWQEKLNANHFTAARQILDALGELSTRHPTHGMKDQELTRMYEELENHHWNHE